MAAKKRPKTKPARKKIGRDAQGRFLKKVPVVKVAKPKKQVEITYWNLKLSDDFKSLVKQIRRELIKKGCFFSYKTIVKLYIKHARWFVFYKKDVKYDYPCGLKFKEIADKAIIFGGYAEEDYSYLNDIVDATVNFINTNNVRKYYIRTFWGQIKRYKSILALTEAMDEYLSVLWEGIKLMGDVESPFFSNVFRFEKNIDMLCVDFMSVQINGYPIDELLATINLMYENER